MQNGYIRERRTECKHSKKETSAIPSLICSKLVAYLLTIIMLNNE